MPNLPPLATLLLGLLLTACAAPGCDADRDALFPQRTGADAGADAASADGDAAAAWVVVWKDDFDGPAGAAPDPTRWRYDLGRGEGGWGNAELQTYTDRADNVALSGDGELVITARREPLDGAEYTSARLKTQGLWSTTYGRVEARLWLPTGAGLWPAFWMLGDDITTVGWPACGEIDVMEYRGQHPDTVIGSLHGPGYSGGGAISDVYALPDGERFDQGFHVFAVEWAPGRVTWYVDDVAFHEVTPSDLPAGTPWVFDAPFFLILNVAVGGTFVGPPNAATAFPQTLRADWVRVLAPAG